MALEVKSVNLLGMPVAYACAVKAGPWVFLTGHEAFDWETGTVDASVAGPAGFPAYGSRHPSRREADFVLQRLTALLREYGTDLAHAVRLDQYYPNPRAVAAYHLSRHENFRDYIPPSTSVVMERLFDAGSTISTSLIAVTPEAGRQIRKVHPPGVASAPTSGFVPAVVCDEFVFVAGQMAHNPGTGLDARAVVPDYAAWAGIPIRRQTEFLIEHKLKPALEAAGSSLAQSVKAQVYLADIADAPDCLDVWNRYYAGIPCAVTVVPTKSFATAGGIIEINLIALTDDAGRKKEVIAADIPAMAAQGPHIKVGEFLLPSGLMAIASDGHIAGHDLFAALCRAVACRFRPGQGGLRPCRSAVPGSRDEHGPAAAGAIFHRRHRRVFGGRDGLGGTLRQASASLCLRPDADPDAGARLCADRRLLDLDRGMRSKRRRRSGWAGCEAISASAATFLKLAVEKTR
ncbi:MAG TPA: RidA family protein [Stellaceae bacterium]|nr:RidA family protein [Stellaceae bacterium]